MILAEGITLSVGYGGIWVQPWTPTGNRWTSTPLSIMTNPLPVNHLESPPLPQPRHRPVGGGLEEDQLLPGAGEGHVEEAAEVALTARAQPATESIRGA